MRFHAYAISIFCIIFGLSFETRFLAHAQPLTGGIVINEIFPDPGGSDLEEYVEIKNISMTPQLFDGWKLFVGNQKKPYLFPSGRIVAPGQFLILKKSETHKLLSNMGGSLSLANPRGEVVDRLLYERSVPKKSYSRANAGTFFWTPRMTPGRENQIESAPAKIITPQKNAPAKEKTVSKKNEIIRSAEIKRLRGLPSRSLVRITGVVSAEPGVLSASFFYLADPAIQIFNSKKLFPLLHVGDTVSIDGAISHAGGETRINVANASAIAVTAHGATVTPRKSGFDTIGEQTQDMLVRVTGTVSDVRWPSITMKDADREVMVYVGKRTAIPKQNIEKGDQLDVVGIVDATATGYRVLPRHNDDIRLAEHSSESRKILIPQQIDRRRSPLLYFGIVCATALLSGIVWYIRFRKKKEL